MDVERSFKAAVGQVHAGSNGWGHGDHGAGAEEAAPKPRIRDMTTGPDAAGAVSAMHGSEGHHAITRCVQTPNIVWPMLKHQRAILPCSQQAHNAHTTNMPSTLSNIFQPPVELNSPWPRSTPPHVSGWPAAQRAPPCSTGLLSGTTRPVPPAPAPCQCC